MLIAIEVVVCEGLRLENVGCTRLGVEISSCKRMCELETEQC